jgi:hypothetical protein
MELFCHVSLTFTLANVSLFSKLVLHMFHGTVGQPVSCTYWTATCYCTIQANHKDVLSHMF